MCKNAPRTDWRNTEFSVFPTCSNHTCSCSVSTKEAKTKLLRGREVVNLHIVIVNSNLPRVRVSCTLSAVCCSACLCMKQAPSLWLSWGALDKCRTVSIHPSPNCCCAPLDNTQKCQALPWVLQSTRCPTWQDSLPDPQAVKWGRGEEIREEGGAAKGAPPFLQTRDVCFSSYAASHLFPIYARVGEYLAICVLAQIQRKLKSKYFRCS